MIGINREKISEAIIIWICIEIIRFLYAKLFKKANNDFTYAIEKPGIYKYAIKGSIAGQLPAIPIYTLDIVLINNSKKKTIEDIEVIMLELPNNIAYFPYEKEKDCEVTYNENKPGGIIKISKMLPDSFLRIFLSNDRMMQINKPYDSVKYRDGIGKEIKMEWRPVNKLSKIMTIVGLIIGSIGLIAIIYMLLLLFSYFGQ